jgi:hypothetical protein
MLQLVDALPQERVGQQGLVDGLADEARRQVREVKVDDPLPVLRAPMMPPPRASSRP